MSRQSRRLAQVPIKGSDRVPVGMEDGHGASVSHNQTSRLQESWGRWPKLNERTERLMHSLVTVPTRREGIWTRRAKILCA